MIRKLIVSTLIAVTLSAHAEDRVQHQPVEHRAAGEQSSSGSKDRTAAIFAAVAIGIGVAVVLSRNTQGEPQTTVAPSADPETRTPMITLQARFN